MAATLISSTLTSITSRRHTILKCADFERPYIYRTYPSPLHLCTASRRHTIRKGSYIRRPCPLPLHLLPVEAILRYHEKISFTVRFQFRSRLCMPLELIIMTLRFTRSSEEPEAPKDGFPELAKPGFGKSCSLQHATI